jgi:hypothetical protein
VRHVTVRYFIIIIIIIIIIITIIIIIITPLQSNTGHRPLTSRHLARSLATRIQLLPSVLRKSSLHLA